MQTMNFIRRPVEVMSCQINTSLPKSQWPGWLASADKILLTTDIFGETKFVVPTNEGEKYAENGDWIVYDYGKGRYEVHTNEMMHELYEER